MIAGTATTGLNAVQLSAGQLNAGQKAEIIYAQARSEMADGLWRAALGMDSETAKPIGGDRALPMSLDALLSLLEDRKAVVAQPMPQLATPAPQAAGSSVRATGADAEMAWGGASGNGAGRGDASGSGDARGYGPNAGHAATLSAAAERTGLPAAALATIVHAEAAKGSDGRWLPYSRNPRSSAAGLGQFLSGTWRGEAEREGTWLHMVAGQRGWLDAHGKVKGEDRGALLALRYDPEASIQATADYAKANLDALRRAGVAIGEDAQAIARTAYLGHHLGRGDAVRFLKGGLDPDRARALLNAQVGSASASRRIAASGDATTAHRSWLLDYIGRNIRPERFHA
jgi:hypothetical protein